MITCTDEEESAERLMIFDSVEEIISSDAGSSRNSSGDDEDMIKTKEFLLKSNSIKKSLPMRRMSSRQKLEQ